MAERPTARSADPAVHDHDDAARVVDSWISRQSRLAAGDSDSDDRRQEVAAPGWHADLPDEYDESYPPADTRHGHEARHARRRAHPQDVDEYDQHTYPAPRHAYPASDPPAFPEPAYDDPDRTYLSDSYLSDEHDQAYRAERGAYVPYEPTDATSVDTDGDTAQLERYAAPEAAYAYGEYPEHDDVGRDEYHREEPDAKDPGTEEHGLRPRRRHHREVARPRPASRRRRWMIPVGVLAVGALLCALVLKWGSDRPPAGGVAISTAPTPSDAFQQPIALSEPPSTPPSSTTPRRSSATPSATPSVTPSAEPSVTPSAAPSATPTTTSIAPAPTRSSDPVLLGPSNRRGVVTMAQGYCDRYTGGSADPRNDGRWQCSRLLSSSIVDMDVACRDTYDSDAYAQTSRSGDSYAWRCYH